MSGKPGSDMPGVPGGKCNLYDYGVGVSLLAENGWHEPEWLVVQGPPEKAAGYMRGHGLVAASYPGKDGARAELLAHLANPVLLFPEQHEE